MDLTKQKCVPCEGGSAPFTPDEIKIYMTYLKTPWEEVDDAPSSPKVNPGDGKKIEKRFKFKGFKESMAFVNKVAEIAEAEGHHPNMDIAYIRVRITLWTHAIGGLSANDFILASKIDLL